MWKDFKNKLLIGLIVLCVGQALAIFGLVHNMNGKIESLQKNQQTMMAAMMKQQPLPEGPVPQ